MDRLHNILEFFSFLYCTLVFPNQRYGRSFGICCILLHLEHPGSSCMATVLLMNFACPIQQQYRHMSHSLLVLLERAFMIGNCIYGWFIGASRLVPIVCPTSFFFSCHFTPASYHTDLSQAKQSSSLSFCRTYHLYTHVCTRAMSFMIMLIDSYHSKQYQAISRKEATVQVPLSTRTVFSLDNHDHDHRVRTVLAGTGASSTVAMVHPPRGSYEEMLTARPSNNLQSVQSTFDRTNDEMM